MNLTEALNLSIPLRRAENGDVIIHGYHTPISREVFEANYRILAATKAAIFGKGIAFASDSGPRIAALRLRDEARQDALERGDLDRDGNLHDRGATALLAELKRLTMALVPTPQGWSQVPIEVAISSGAIDAEDWSEAESALVFFTCGYAMATRRDKARMARGLAGVMGSSITSLPLTEYAASLATSTQVNDTPVRASSIPS